MTEKQKINAKAKLAFDKDDYKVAFETLWGLGISDFVAYCLREESKSKKTNWFDNNFFWEVFIGTEIVFDAIFNSDYIEQILHQYFTKFNKPVRDFEIKLVNKYPLIFIKAIRVNQVFLKENRIEILKTIQLDSKFEVHQRIWLKFYNIEQILWAKIQNKLNDLSELSLNTILSHCIIWFENSRFTDSSQQKLNGLGNIYSFFIELVLQKFPEKQNDISDDDNFHKQFIEVFVEFYKNNLSIETSAVSMLLESIAEWMNYKDYFIDPYSFDLNIEPSQENELIYFNSTPEAYYKWLENGKRYELNELMYRLNSQLLVEILEQNSKLEIPGNTEIDIELNKNLVISKCAILQMLEDMACNSFKIGNKQIEPEKLLEPLITYVFNRASSYEQRLQTHIDYSKNWFEAFSKLMKDSSKDGILREPFFLMTEVDYIKLNKDALNDLPNQSTEFIELFSHITTQKHQFNRFNIRYNVWIKPFSKIRNFLFCPMLFFANNSWFYTFAQVALFQKTPRSETQEMERYLGELLKNKGWKVKVISGKEAYSINGDVDIFVEDNDTSLFIQLKRTYFRLDLKDAYYESINTDFKAAQQLNEAEKFLKSDKSIYLMRHKPVKWIVTTSFENIGSKINGCHKINYFELLHYLDISKNINLCDFINDMEANKILMDFNPEISKFEIAMFESQVYKQRIFSENKQTNEDTKFSEALRLDKEGKKEQALILLQKYVSDYPNNGVAFGAIANILAEMKLFDNSFYEFNKALKLLPNDPFISKNYSLALIEAGKFYDGLILLTNLFEKFPLLSDIKTLFTKVYVATMGHLNSNQRQELEARCNNFY